MKNVFFRYCDWLVVLIAVVCLYAILQIKFDFAFWVGYTINAKAINEVISNLSYSYIAAFVFYILTVRLPHWKMRYKIKKALNNKIKTIRLNYKACVDTVLPLGENPRNEVSREEVVNNFKAVSYKNPCRFSLNGSNESILGFINRNHQYILHLSEELLEYKPWLSADTIAQIEKIRNSRLPGFIFMMSKLTFTDPDDEIKMREQLAGYIYGLWDLSKRIEP